MYLLGEGEHQTSEKQTDTLRELVGKVPGEENLREKQSFRRTACSFQRDSITAQADGRKARKNSKIKDLD